MKNREIKDILEAEIITGAEYLERDIEMGCDSDLMSDVLAFIKSGALLLTGLSNAQVIRTAEMADISTICFVRGKQPSPEVMKLAQEISALFHL